jgi:glycosyltransferase involved in cell wall biosynthesis
MAEEIRRRAIPGVHLGGILTGAELSTAYASADLFVFPSTTETFGNSLLEAMASGLACLTVRAGGIPEFARHEVNALMVDPHDTGALTAGLERLFADWELRGRLREGGLATAQSRGWDRIHDGLLQEYRDAVAAGSAERAA